MPRASTYASHEPSEPETRAHAAMKAWFAADDRRTQRDLADAVGCKQQTIGQILARRSRPGLALAELLEAATLGAVERDGWLTDAEAAARRDKLREVALAGARLAVSAEDQAPDSPPAT